MDYQEFLDSVDREAYHEGEWRRAGGGDTRNPPHPRWPPRGPNRSRRPALVDPRGRPAPPRGGPPPPF